MKQKAISSPDVLDEPSFDAPGSDTDSGSFKQLVNLQSDLFDLVVNRADSASPLNAVIERIQDAFSADGAIIVSAAENNDGSFSTYACATPNVHQSVVDFFSNQEKALLPVGTFAVGRGKNSSPEFLRSGTFWSENTNPSADNRDWESIVLVFDEDRQPSAKDRMVLNAISPIIRLVSGAAGNAAALKSANDRFASLASSIPGIVYQRVVTPQGDIRYSYISENAEDLFGVSAKEIVSNPNALFGTYAPEYAKSFREKLIEASRTLSTWDVEASIVAKDGSVKYTHAIANPQRQNDDSVLWTGVILDATRIKEAEIAAAVAEAKTREAIVESLSQGFLLYDCDDRLTLINSHFLRLFPELADTAIAGAHYEQILRAELCAGLDAAQCSRSQSAAFTERMEQRKSKSGYVAERQLSEDVWIMINEHRTSSGDTVVLYTDVSEIKQREERIQHMAHHDALTGLPNRVLFQSRVKDAIEQSEKDDKMVAICCLDLDHFKNVNDTLGHPAGDALLCIVAERIKAEIRDVDTVARLGGDEFAIVLSGLKDQKLLDRVANRILKSLALPVSIDGHETVTGASMGIAILSKESSDSNKLLKNADLALYRAKTEGRNAFRFFKQEMDESALARRKVEVDLRLAIERDQLQLYFQPLVNTGDDKIAGFEALVRWNHPELGLVCPDDFISVAEETGLIVPMGEWVLRTACAEAVKWSVPVKVAVNISPAQFKQTRLVEFISKTLKETTLDPGRLELEITETVLMRNTAETMETLYRLKGLGVRIAMDDFGTGYSSLGNLRSFPFDKIKIDRSFVSDLGTNAEAAAIVRAVVGLGRSLGIDTTAEGVETRDQLVYLRIEGCSEIQGFYYSKPRPGDDIADLLEDNTAGRKMVKYQPDPEPESEPD